MRTSGDKMLYGTGAAYVMGVSAGGIMGMYRGLRSKAMKELVGSGASWRLKMNSVVNSTTRYGPWLGNSWGMLSKFLDLFYFLLTSKLTNNLTNN